jgi:hypothetical protein
MLDKLTDLPLDQVIHFLSIDDYVRASLTSREISRKRLTRSRSQYRKMKTPYICLLGCVGYRDKYEFIDGPLIKPQCEELLLGLDPDAFTKKYHKLHRNHDLINIAIHGGYDQFYTSVRLYAVPQVFKQGFDPMVPGRLNTSKYVDAKLNKYIEKIENIIPDVDGDVRKDQESKMFQRLCKKRKSIEQFIGAHDPHYQKLNKLLHDKLHGQYDQ